MASPSAHAAFLATSGPACRRWLAVTSDAFELMLEHAAQIGADAVIGARYDANEVTAGVTEVLAYGTAVKVEKI